MKSNSKNSKHFKKYDCEECKDLGFIITGENTVRFCKCRKLKESREMIEKSGIAKAFRNKTFQNFEETNEITSNAKKIAINYVKNFNEILSEKNNSIAFLGQVGSGKTHLSVSIANALLNKNIPVIYMQYRDVISQLKRNMLDDVYYTNQINKYKNAKLLVIDDLFKGKITEADLNIMFEIINHRYFNLLPIVISSEKSHIDLLDIDEAIGSRIIEMCKKRIILFDDVKLNYRLKI